MRKYAGEIVDMHCHVLPGVDDGAESFEQSINMLRISIGEGVSTVVATPHLVCDGSERLYAARIREAYEKLNRMILELSLPVRIVLGYELLLSASLLHVENIRDFGIEGTDRLLVEPKPDEPPEMLDELIYELRHMKTGLILAHPERNYWLARNVAYLRTLAERGVLMQANAGSITGEWGRSAALAAKRMARHGLIHLIGSDAHSDRTRKPEINAATAAMCGWMGEKAAGDIACRTAQAILNMNHKGTATEYEMRQMQHAQ